MHYRSWNCQQWEWESVRSDQEVDALVRDSQGLCHRVTLIAYDCGCCDGWLFHGGYPLRKTEEKTTVLGWGVDGEWGVWMADGAEAASRLGCTEYLVPQVAVAE